MTRKINRNSQKRDRDDKKSIWVKLCIEEIEQKTRMRHSLTSLMLEHIKKNR